MSVQKKNLSLFSQQNRKKKNQKGYILKGYKESNKEIQNLSPSQKTKQNKLTVLYLGTVDIIYTHLTEVPKSCISQRLQ